MPEVKDKALLPHEAVAKARRTLAAYRGEPTRKLILPASVAADVVACRVGCVVKGTAFAVAEPFWIADPDGAIHGRAWLAEPEAVAVEAMEGRVAEHGLSSEAMRKLWPCATRLFLYRVVKAAAEADVAKPVGPFENFAACVAVMRLRGHGEEEARRMCGAMERG